jgi:hypothetical protein
MKNLVSLLVVVLLKIIFIVTSAAGILVSSSLKKGLVAYYPFDGNADDNSGNGNHGVIHGAVTVNQDRFGNTGGAYNFIGGYIDVDGTQFNFPNNMSVALWMNPVFSQTPWGALIDKSSSNSAGQSVGGFSIKQSGALNNQYSFYFVPESYSPGSVGYKYYSPPISMPSSTWNHFAVSKNGQNVKVYLNAVLVSSTDMSASTILPSGQDSLVIGGWSFSHSYPASDVESCYSGGLDDIFIYNRTLTLSEIQQLISFGAPSRQPSSQPTLQPSTQPTIQISSTLKNGLVAYYPFVDGNVQDASGNDNHGILHRGSRVANAMVDRAGNPRHAMNFNGSNYIEISAGEHFNFAQNMSVSLWIRPSAAIPTTYANLLDKSSTTSGGGLVSAWQIQQDGTVNGASVYPLGFSYRTLSAPLSTPDVPLVMDTWNHVVFSKQGFSVVLYLNGHKYQNTFVANDNAATVSNYRLPLIIGASNGGQSSPATNLQRFFQGGLDDIFIYNRSVSAAEVLQLYALQTPTSQPSEQPSSQPSAQPVLHPSAQPTRQPSSQPSSHPSALPSIPPTAQPTRIPTSQPSSRPSAEPTLVPSEQPTSQPSRQPTSQPSRHPSTQPTSIPTGQPTLQPSSFISGTLRQGLVAYYPFDGNANDQSGNGNHGVMYSASLTSDRFSGANRAYSFDGSSSYIIINNGLAFDFSNSFSVSCWINPAPSQSGEPSIFSKSHGSSGGSSWLIYRHGSSATSFSFEYLQAASTWVTSLSATDLVANQWNHYLLTKQNTKLSSYLNGNLVSTAFGSDPAIRTNGNAPLFIAAAYNNYFKGCLDDILIYNRTITALEALALYQFGMPTSQPTGNPTSQPSNQPFTQPTSHPSSQPSHIPTTQPSSYPTTRPTSQPTNRPSVRPSNHPSCQPTIHPSGQPSSQPSHTPTSQPSFRPSSWPSSTPTIQPTGRPSLQPFSYPSCVPSSNPSTQPSKQPSSHPSCGPSTKPSSQPTSPPSVQPSKQPLSQPTSRPSTHPSKQPSSRPSSLPSMHPSSQPTSRPSTQPSKHPLSQPTSLPSAQPSKQPLSQPTSRPSIQPSKQPISQPTSLPSAQPSKRSIGQPTSRPSTEPSKQPISQPTSRPSTRPSNQPSSRPSSLPSMHPSSQPTSRPSTQPSQQPISQPTSLPSTHPSKQPLSQPTSRPSTEPSKQPISQPTSLPSAQPSKRSISQPTSRPSTRPSNQPSSRPSSLPSMHPSSQPTCHPSTQPSTNPSNQSTSRPSSQPSTHPSSRRTSCPPAQPSTHPSKLPSSCPSSFPSTGPSGQPISRPSVHPSTPPSNLPTSLPSRKPYKQPSSQIPSTEPSIPPSSFPTTPPSSHRTCQPSGQPTSVPTGVLSHLPSGQPTSLPINQPTFQPAGALSQLPSSSSSSQPTFIPFSPPTISPSCQSTSQFSSRPASRLINNPTSAPSCQPTVHLTSTSSESLPLWQPAFQPTALPSGMRSCAPTTKPQKFPTAVPRTQPSSPPTTQSTGTPSSQPLGNPSSSPCQYPAALFTSSPSHVPTDQPPFTYHPSFRPVVSAPIQTISVFPLGNMNFKISLFVFGTYLPVVQHVPNIYLTEGLIGSSYIIFGAKKRKSKEIMIGSRNSEGLYSNIVNDAGLIQDRRMSRSSLPIGDFNADWYEDLLVCDPVNSICRIYFGNGSRYESYLVIKSDNHQLFGWSTAKLSDVNGDGCEDIAITALSSNIIYLIFGTSNVSVENIFIKNNSLPSLTGIRIIGSQNDQNTGLALSSAGDFNHDGYSDILFSAFQVSPFRNVIYILFLNSKMMTQDIYIQKLYPNLNYLRIVAPVFSFAGISLSGLGDINQDGFDDIIIGSIPYSGGYLTQKSYVIYGRNTTQSTLLSQMTEEEGFTIVGSGFMVGAPGDVNDDGIPDIMVSSYQQWQGKGNSYIMIYPRNVSRQPTLLPSSLPSFTPSVCPSSFPSTTVHPPTAVPTFAETTSEPATEGTFPPFLPRTPAPSRTPVTAKPSGSTSTKPSTISPTVKKILPSVSPTRMPTINPARKPTISPSTMIPSRSPTRNPSTFPTSFPSITAAESVSSSPLPIRMIDKAGEYNEPSGKGNYIISGDGMIQITGNGGGKKVYTILPAKNVITIIDFNKRHDQISLIYFPYLYSIGTLSYRTHPLQLTLSAEQALFLPSMNATDLTEDNFIFQKSEINKKKQTNNVWDQSSVVNAFVVVIGCGALVALIMRRNSKDKDVKNKIVTYPHIENEKELKKGISSDFDSILFSSSDNEGENNDEGELNSSIGNVKEDEERERYENDWNESASLKSLFCSDVHDGSTITSDTLGNGELELGNDSRGSEEWELDESSSLVVEETFIVDDFDIEGNCYRNDNEGIVQDFRLLSSPMRR